MAFYGYCEQFDGDLLMGFNWNKSNVGGFDGDLLNQSGFNGANDS